MLVFIVENVQVEGIAMIFEFVIYLRPSVRDTLSFTICMGME